MGRIFTALLPVIWVFLSLPAFAQEPVPVRGTGVTLTPPEGYVLSGSFTGFTGPSGARLTVGEGSLESIEDMRPNFANLDSAKTHYESSRATVVELGSVEGAEGTVPFVHVVEESVLGNSDIWYAILAGEQGVAITLRQKDPDILDPEDVKAMLASVMLGTPPTLEEKVALLPFEVEPDGPFSYAEVTNGSSLTLKAPEDENGYAPTVLISGNASLVSDSANVSRDMEQLFSSAFTLDRDEAVLFADDDAWLKSGVRDGDAVPGGLLRAIQWAAMNQNGFLGVHAYLPENRREELMPAIEAIAQSVHWKSAPRLVAGKPVRVPGTSIAMAPPPGFVPAADFAGFIEPETGASILVVEMAPEARAEMEGVFDSRSNANAAFRAQGIDIEEVGSVESHSGTIHFGRGEQRVRFTDLQKWIALVESDRLVMVTFSFPEEFEFETLTGMLALSTIALMEPPSLIEQVAALPFTLAASDPFVFEATLAGSTVTLVAGESGPDDSGARPLIIVEYAPLPGVEGRTPDASEDLLRGTYPQYRELVIDRRNQVQFAGRDGWMISGTVANEGSAGGTLRVSQWMSTEETGLTRMFVQSLAEDYDGLSDAIERIAASVERPGE